MHTESHLYPHSESQTITLFSYSTPLCFTTLYREMPRDCFESADWDVLLDPRDKDNEGIAGCLTDYRNICVDVVSSVKTVPCFSNKKPWITQVVKGVLNRKKVTFRIKERSVIKSAVGEAVPVGGTIGHLQEKVWRRGYLDLQPQKGHTISG